MKCYNCNKEGRIGRNCPEKGKDKDNESKKEDDKGKDKGKGKEKEKEKEKSGNEGEKTNVKSTGGTLYTAMGDALMASSDFSGAYFIDSGASDHLTPDQHLLHSYVKFKRP